MHVLVIYHSFTGQAARVAEQIAGLNSEQGHETTLCRIDFADAAEPRTTPVDTALIGRWAKAARTQVDYPVTLSVDPGELENIDLVVLLSNTWSFSPSVPVQSFLRSEAANVVRGKPVAIGIVCRGFWKKNLSMTRALVEQRGGLVVAHEVFDHAGSWLASTVTNLFGMTRNPPLPKRWGPLPLPPFGVSPQAMQRIEPFLTRAAIAASPSSPRG